MIGPKVRLVLVAAAWIYVAVGIFRAMATMYVPIFHPEWPRVHSVDLDWERAAWSLLTPLVESGVLLVLLSIDQRLERKVL